MARWWQRALRAAQVETQGQYSTERVVALARFSRETSALRAVAILVLTPLPAVAVTVMMDTIPLARPEEGVDANWQFLLRLFLAVVIFAFLTTEQFAHYLPSLPLSHRRAAVHAVIVSAATTAFIYAAARAVGFPVPFTLMVGSSMWMFSLSSLLWIAWGRHIRRDAGLWRPISNSLVVWACQIVLTLIYPTYFYGYLKFPQSGRIGFAFLLPVIKLILRVWLSHSVTHLRDELPEVVVMNAEVFNALFVMYCMQNTPSLFTTLGLMGIDLAQSAYSLRDISYICKDIKAESARMSLSIPNRECLLEKAEWLISNRRDRTHLLMVSSSKSSVAIVPQIPLTPTCQRSHPTPVGGSVRQIFPLPQPRVDDHAGEAQNNGVEFGPTTNSTSVAYRTQGSSEDRYVDAIERLLYVTEFLMLLNYVEVIIPFIYSAYLAIIFHLPNRVFYAHIDAMTDGHLRSALLSTVLYASLELFSLLSLHCVLVYKLRLPGVAQLAFVLRSQWIGVQIKVVFWVLFNAQAALQHSGSDYSFTFSWLHTSLPASNATS